LIATLPYGDVAAITFQTLASSCGQPAVPELRTTYQRVQSIPGHNPNATMAENSAWRKYALDSKKTREFTVRCTKIQRRQARFFD
jgi:hypothetical protein